MKCPKCGSNNITFQIVSEQKLKTKHHGVLYWMFIGWWLLPIMWLFFTFYMILGSLFGHKRQKIVTIHRSMAVCQNCGYSWKQNNRTKK